MIHGIPAAEGIGIGPAAVLRESLDYAHVVPAGAEAEKARLLAAVAACAQQTAAMAQAVQAKVGPQRAAILNGQVVMLSDPIFLGQVNGLIDGGACAEAAVDRACRGLMGMFAALDTELLRQRATDIGDIRARLLGQLLGRPCADLTALPEGAVLVVHDLTPSMMAALDRARVQGILAEVGGLTSHSAILARAMGLPAVLGAPGATELVREGDTVVVDGGEGVALAAPSAAVLDEYRARQARRAQALAGLEPYRTRPTADADGRPLLLRANIASLRDVAQALDRGAEGVGLLRTEFLFLGRAALPTEEEQYDAYRRVVEAFSPQEVVVRTLDVSGDKDLPCLGLSREDNPELGLRGVRCCLDRPEVFRIQLRALLRASAHGSLRILLPMVSCVDELRAVRALLEEGKAELDRARVPYDRGVRLGVMVETPAAVLTADLLTKEVDFFSIGTNDLTQYTMAADRSGGGAAGLCSPLQPAVLRSIRAAVAAGRAGGIPVALCGEAAADPLLLPLLLSFGLTEFSVGTGAILSTRRRIAQWSMQDADRVAEGAMALATEAEVREYLTECMR